MRDRVSIAIAEVLIRRPRTRRFFWRILPWVIPVSGGERVALLSLCKSLSDDRTRLKLRVRELENEIAMREGAFI